MTHEVFPLCDRCGNVVADMKTAFSPAGQAMCYCVCTREALGQTWSSGRLAAKRSGVAFRIHVEGYLWVAAASAMRSFEETVGPRLVNQDNGRLSIEYVSHRIQSFAQMMNAAVWRIRDCIEDALTQGWIAVPSDILEAVPISPDHVVPVRDAIRAAEREYMEREPKREWIAPAIRNDVLREELLGGETTASPVTKLTMHASSLPEHERARLNTWLSRVWACDICGADLSQGRDVAGVARCYRCRVPIDVKLRPSKPIADARSDWLVTSGRSWDVLVNYVLDYWTPTALAAMTEDRLALVAASIIDTYHVLNGKARS